MRKRKGVKWKKTLYGLKYVKLNCQKVRKTHTVSIGSVLKVIGSMWEVEYSAPNPPSKQKRIQS